MQSRITITAARLKGELKPSQSFSKSCPLIRPQSVLAKQGAMPVLLVGGSWENSNRSGRSLTWTLEVSFYIISHEVQKRPDYERKLAELLRGNQLRPVYHRDHGLRTLKELGRSYLVLTQEVTRVMSRIKALYRSWAIPQFKATAKLGEFLEVRFS